MPNAPWFDLLVKLSPGLLLGAVLVVLLGIYALSTAGTERSLRRDGSVLLPRILIGFWYWLVTPIISGLDRLGVRPNHITLFSLYLAALAAVALGTGYFMVGCWLVIAAASCDLLDGLLARQTDAGSPAGAFLDSFADRIAEGMVFAGIAFYGGGGALTWLALWAMLASVMVSYARARGEGLGADCKVGLMQRPERLLLLILTLFAAPIAAVFLEPGAQRPVFHVAIFGIGLLAALSTVTAVRRAHWIFSTLAGQSHENGAPIVGADEPDEGYTHFEQNAGVAE
ncbi:CDP-alcohol phosphatidyltransferase family protein [Persicimonas caeni]|jgi:phosphatidylglycerophosphate synthase|uniref:CDP-alcohol phosphatidyltransferase family protein n=1 Tax=Persicimonas caeni TaxID=2292766 RepID=A0A4Y6PRF6_PERCE|nr:CDP-alcohol phosphatidyltransferase family protein [Persicimonas caeni]QDG50908.1 CDP-alcohol phosphatidyltransferase family protein [Persicimonas caeni]QED32129.1 CDP-alcohol phosphatidyltransferase family protein [Persicimonas caeni]